MSALNRYSFAVVAVAGLALVWTLVRRRGRLIRWGGFVASAMLLALVWATLRTPAPVRDAGDLDRALASGRPVVLELFSNY